LKSVTTKVDEDTTVRSTAKPSSGESVFYTWQRMTRLRARQK